MVVASQQGRQTMMKSCFGGQMQNKADKSRKRLVKEGIAYVQMQEAEDYLLVVEAVDDGTNYYLRRYNAVAGSV